MKNIERILKCFKFGFGMLQKNMYFASHSQRFLSTEVTAGILIIGDEILQGITDVNTPFLIKQLNEINVQVRKVAIVPDNVDALAEEIFDLSSKCSFVVTSGGIGPTHDDVTYEAVAKACNDELCLNEDLYKLFVNYFGAGSEKNAGVIKYSHIPKSSVVNYIDLNHLNKVIKYPVISVRNVYVFPGVPILLQKSFNVFKSRFTVKNQRKFVKDIFINIDEFSFIEILNEAVRKFENVKFGSYPTFNNNYYKVKVSLESKLFDEIENALRYFSQELPEGSIVNIRKDISSAKDYVNRNQKK